jgi:thiosulfate reductase/polysulfide reductase chain A
MDKKSVYSICAMCTVRCPITVDLHNGRITHIWGNPHVIGGYNLCPRGIAGKAFQYDTERPQYPMIRDGARGSGKWRKVSWDEALDYVAGKLKAIIEDYGPRSIVASNRGGPVTDFEKTFIAALGSPNFFTHQATCQNSLLNAHMSVAGIAANAVGYNYKNCAYMVVYGRNLLESLGTAEAKNIIDMINSGGTMVHIDVRCNLTAAKANKFFIIRPGADYALNLALIHVIVHEGLYDKDFVKRHVAGLDELKIFTASYTPQWAEKETGIEASDIAAIAREAAAAKPAVIFHPGWQTAWTSNDYYLRRSIYILNALLGTYEAKGGLFFKKGPGDVGMTIKTLFSQVTPVKEERFDGAGTLYPHLSAQWGLAQTLPQAVTNSAPYPIKAYIVMRHDPIASLPDPDIVKDALNKLELLVSVDVNYSETAWFSDVILPESTYLERTDSVIILKGLLPRLALRQKAVEPEFDSKPRSYIFKELARRLGIEQYFPYTTIEELIAWQLEDTGFFIEDFEEKGIIELSGGEPLWFDRNKELPFKTSSGKFEIISEKLEKAGIPSLEPYVTPQKPEKGRFKLITGKAALHTQGRTTANNPLLHALMPENTLWINTDEAQSLGIKDGSLVEISSQGVKERLTAYVTDFIHPEAVYMLHGFGDSVPLRTRSYKKGANDMKLQKGLLKVTTGGNCPLTECIVAVQPV